MRLVATVVLVLLLSATTTSAVRITAKGVKVGLNIGSVGSVGYSYSEAKLGAAIGGFSTIGINRMIAVQPEVLYTMKGWQSGVEFFDQYGTPVGRGYWRYSLNYLEIPVLIRVTVQARRGVRINSSVGPYGGIKIASTWRLDPPPGWENWEDCEGYPTGGELEYVRRFDFGMVFGAGFDVAIGPGAVLCEARYALGLTEIREASYWWPLGKNRVFTVMLGYAW